METIAIPPPTVFLNSPILASPAVRRTKPKVTKAKKDQLSAPKVKAAAASTASTSKPKQSKSRNGTFPRSRLIPYVCINWTNTMSRLCDLQSEEVEVRRDKTNMSAVPQAPGGMWRL